MAGEGDELPPQESSGKTVVADDADAEGGQSGTAKDAEDESISEDADPVPLLGQRYHDSDWAITVQATPSDMTFEPPPMPKSWLAETALTTSTSPSSQSDTVNDDRGWSSRTMISTPIVSALGATVGSAVVMWVARREQARRHAFALTVERLERGLESLPEHLARDPALSEGSLGAREQEALRRLDMLKVLIGEGLEAGRRCPWEARGRSSRRVRDCSRRLSEKAERMERAVEELRVMAEIEQLLGDLDSNTAEREGEYDDQADFFGSGDDSDSDDSDREGKNGGHILGPRRGEGAVNDSGATVPPSRRPVRLCIRAKALLAKRAEDDYGKSGPSAKSSGRGENAPGRCVFRAELRNWCATLSAREQEAKNRLNLGLGRWDLKMVDGALAQLRLMELPDLVQAFRGKRNDVRSKLWRLKEELKEAEESATTAGHVSCLREACVKAETFSAKAFPEYRSAKRTLEQMRLRELEVQARRIKAAHGVVADPGCNVLHSSHGPTLLLKDLPDFGSGSGDPRLAIRGGADVSRRLALESADEHESAPGAGDGPGENNSVFFGGCESDGTSSAGINTTANGQRSNAGASGHLAMWSPMSADGSQTQQHMADMQHMQTLMTVRRSAEGQFLAYVTQREDEHRRACHGDRQALERREDKDVYRQDYINRLDTHTKQEEQKLRIQEKWLRVDEEGRRHERDENERIRDEKRLARLWCADSRFFSCLALVDASIASATIAWMKGFSLAPEKVLQAVWGFVIADCIGENGNADGFSEGNAGQFSSASPSLPPSRGALSSHRGTRSSIASGVSNAASTVASMCDVSFGGKSGALSPYGDDLSGGVVGENGMQCAGMAPVSDDGSEGTTGKALWWAWSTAGSAAGTVLRASYSSAGWVLGQTLGFVTPDVQCEMRAVLSLLVWLVSLVLVLKVVGWAGADGAGPTSATIRLTVLSAWVWGRFNEWLLSASRELLLFVVPVPALVLLYGAALPYIERHCKPGGFWWVKGWDVRPIISRILPTGMSTLLAWFLGTQSS